MKNNFKNILYNALGYVFPVGVALFTTPYIVHKLTPEIYGIYVLAIFLMGVMSFLDLGFGQGIVKFVSQYEAKNDYERINKIIGVSLIIYLGMGLLGCVLILLFSNCLVENVFKISREYVQAASLAFRIVAFGFLISFVGGIFSNLPKALQRYDISVKIQNIVFCCSTISVVILLYFRKGLIEVLIAYVFFQLVGIIIYYNASKKILPTIIVKLEFDKAVFKEIFGFSIFTAANTVTGNIVVRVDKMIIGGFLGTSAVAYYSIPFMIVQMCAGFIGAITQHLFPGVSYIQGLKNKERLTEIYKRAFRYVISLSLIIAISLILLGDSFLKLWMGQEFALKSSGILPIISLVFFFSSITSISIWFYTGLGHTNINLFSSFVGSACYLLGAIFLIPKLGLYGAALSFVLILVPFPIYHYYLLKKILGISLNWYFNIFMKSLLLLGFTVIIKTFFYIRVNSIIILFVKEVEIILLLSILLIVLGIFDRKEMFFVIQKLKPPKVVKYE
jgi:O-antigen/teichoic acid export membrane protein